LKKTGFILLFVVLTIPFWGSYLFFQFTKNKIKQEVDCLLKSNSENIVLIELAFSLEQAQNELIWEHSREFEFNGQMYDIVSQRRLGDSVYYTCYPDHKETRLNTEKDKLISRAMDNDPFQKQQKQRIINFFKTVFQKNEFTWSPVIEAPSIIHYSLFTIHHSLYLPSPPSPPPKSSS
jgi:hypothetical protein